MAAVAGGLLQLDEHFVEAKRKGFPAFPKDIASCTPLNATPYVVTLDRFLSEEWADERRVLLDRLVAAIDRLRKEGLGVELLLVGGSFLDPRKTPNDLDCVIFYSRPTEIALDLISWQDEQKARSLDLRLLPIDIDPVIVLKTALFFGVLYTRGNEAHPQLRGLLLVDCSV
jgi:hypothetical protein